MRFSWQIAKYTIRTILPYLGFTWLLLSVILFVQQASRYSDIFFNNTIPASVVWQLSLALVPNVIAFTCPMAVLIGVIIGLSKLQGDSELVAIRAAGVGNFQITIPIILLGIILSLFAFFINLKGVPFAAQMIRRIAIQNAIYKLESPIEPGVFNTEIQGYTIYVKDGDYEQGTWKNIFIYTEDKDKKQVRLITSRDGRIDSFKAGGEYAENSELVLGNASVSTFSLENPKQNLVSENISSFRLVIKTKRAELIEKLTKSEITPEEMGLKELAQYARTQIGKERTEAEILWQRKIILSITPLIFALLGTSLVLRFNRGGRGWGILLALLSLIIYYLVALFGEQLARTDKISVFISSLFPITLTSLAIFWFFLSQRLFLANAGGFLQNTFQTLWSKLKSPTKRRNTFANLTTGILDYDIVSSLLRYFLLTFSFLTVIYMIFTAFELWKFAGSINNGFSLLIKYLLYLLPFIYIQISPSALMIATLATYVIKSRQNEVVTWTASGQSIYRLLFPCFVLMMIIGGINWGIQEKVLPFANQIQDGLRAQIRNKGVMVLNSGKNWVATDNRIYSFELAENTPTISENQKVKNLNIYQFSNDGTKLQSVTKISEASWEDKKIQFLGKPEILVWDSELPKVSNGTAATEIEEIYNPFKQLQRKPNHLSTAEIKEYIQTTESESEKDAYGVALNKRYSTPFLPLIITLFTAPFALSLHRQGKVMTVGYAVGVWLLFMGISNTFEQYGLSGTLEPSIAVWSPLVLFTVLGLFMLSRVRT